MLKKASLFLFAICVCFSLFSQCPIALEEIKKEAEKRWESFEIGKKFKPFEAGKSDALLKEEFEEIHRVRSHVWTLPEFSEAKNLIVGDFVRAPGCAAFAFNNSISNYNASTILIDERPYIACEGPRSKDIPNFFTLLQTYGVTDLVRLTDSYEGEVKKCHPYWEGLLLASENGEQSLNIPREEGVYTLRAYDMAYWKDHHGIEPEDLLEAALKVRKALKDSNGVLAVHCSAGVGRTGTFLAALAIIDAMDRGAPFSIEEIVYRLSLQRVNSVAKYPQYITLHRLAEQYLKER